MTTNSPRSRSAHRVRLRSSSQSSHRSRGRKLRWVLSRDEEDVSRSPVGTEASPRQELLEEACHFTPPPNGFPFVEEALFGGFNLELATQNIGDVGDIE